MPYHAVKHIGKQTRGLLCINVRSNVTKSRNCFVQIASNLHLADNLKLRKGNRMIKVRHLYDMLNAQCCKSSPNRYNKSVDESMPPYFGRHAKKTC